MNEWVANPYLFQARRPLEIRGIRKPWHWFVGRLHQLQFHNHFWQKRQADIIIKRSEELLAVKTERRDDAISRLRHELRQQPDNIRLHREIFAWCRVLAEETLGMQHYPSQLMAALCLWQGRVVELDTGEGKTLAATPAVVLAALSGMKVHVITANDYLAVRDAEEMSPLYEAFGLTVGAIDNDTMLEQRQCIYRSNIVYVSAKELVFDYLKDRANGLPESVGSALASGLLGNRQSRNVSQLHFAIVDEIDSVLIDEARTPLILSSERPLQEDQRQAFHESLALARSLNADEDFLWHQDFGYLLMNSGVRKLHDQAGHWGGVWQVSAFREALVLKALHALQQLKKDKDYLILEGKVQIIDEYSGRVLPDRAWEQGLHQLVEIKEGVEVTGERTALDKITFPRFFSRYYRMGGMSGTVRETAGELWQRYGIATRRVPRNRPLKRQLLGIQVCESTEQQYKVIVKACQKYRSEGRAILVGTTSVEQSEQLSMQLCSAGVPHRLLNARQDSEEAELIGAAGEAGAVVVATSMAGRGTDIKLSKSVYDAGGLHVITAGLQDSARVNRQLTGRSARQGDPGSYEYILSVEDAIVERLLSDRSGPVYRILRWIRFTHIRYWLLRLVQWRLDHKYFRQRQQQSTDDASFRRQFTLGRAD